MITTTIETITPQVAEEYLRHNTKNRYGCKGNRHVIAALAEDMKAGLWKLNGESIIFDAGGVLVDGQHRLLACIKAGVSFQTLVVRGVDGDAFSTVDIGLPRSGGQLLEIKGVKNCNLAAAAISRYFSLSNSNIQGIGSGGVMLSQIKKTKVQLVEFYNKYPGVIDEVCTNFTSCRGIKVLSQAEMAGISLYLIINKGHRKERVFSFFNQLTSGENVENGTILVLRDKLIKDKIGHERMTQSARLACIRKTWNCYVTGKEVRLFIFRPQSREEDFI